MPDGTINDYAYTYFKNRRNLGANQVVRNVTEVVQQEMQVFAQSFRGEYTEAVATDKVTVAAAQPEKLKLEAPFPTPPLTVSYVDHWEIGAGKQRIVFETGQFNFKGAPVAIQNAQFPEHALNEIAANELYLRKDSPVAAASAALDDLVAGRFTSKTVETHSSKAVTSRTDFFNAELGQIKNLIVENITVVDPDGNVEFKSEAGKGSEVRNLRSTGTVNLGSPYTGSSTANKQYVDELIAQFQEEIDMIRNELYVLRKRISEGKR